MKNKLLQLFLTGIFLFSFTQISAQKALSVSNETANEICPNVQFNGFRTDDGIEKLINKITSQIGLKPNFILIPCPEIKNAMALIYNDNLRYIAVSYTHLDVYKRQEYAYPEICGEREGKLLVRNYDFSKDGGINFTTLDFDTKTKIEDVLRFTINVSDIKFLRTAVSHTGKAVSYTHLDVYKRQIYIRSKNHQ